MIYVLTFLVIAGVFAQNMSDKLFAVRIVGSKSVSTFLLLLFCMFLFSLGYSLRCFNWWL